MKGKRDMKGKGSVDQRSNGRWALYPLGRCVRKILFSFPSKAELISSTDPISTGGKLSISFFLGSYRPYRRIWHLLLGCYLAARALILHLWTAQRLICYPDQAHSSLLSFMSFTGLVIISLESMYLHVLSFSFLFFLA